jgi:membrane protein DedA with SNARE-associated domain
MFAFYVREYYDHKDLIDSYMAGDRTETMYSTKIAGLTIEMFILLLMISMIVWCVSLYYIIRYWDQLPTWVRVVSVLDMIIGTGLISIICILAVTHKNWREMKK